MRDLAAFFHCCQVLLLLQQLCEFFVVSLSRRISGGLAAEQASAIELTTSRTAAAAHLQAAFELITEQIVIGPTSFLVLCGTHTCATR